jgi:hypothetical protein
VDIAPQTKLATYRGLYYFASTSAADLGLLIAGILINAFGKDYGITFAVATVIFTVASICILLARRGEHAETIPA